MQEVKAAATRTNNRNSELLDAAAELFATQGFRETTMRDIAAEAGMLPGSIYYHHGSKDDLLLAVYEAGVENFVAAFSEAVETESDPWQRLRHAMAVHIAAITKDDPYTRVVNRVLPDQVPKHARGLTLLRERYECCFRDVISALPLAPWVDRTLLRLMILGAGNHAQNWFKSDGGETAEGIGRAFERFLEEPIVGDET